MRYYIGIDSGGTKTDSVLFDGIGRVLCRRSDSGCNPYDIGIDASKTKLLTIINQLLELSPEIVTSVFAGVAGLADFGPEFSEYLKEKTGIANLSAGSDAIPLINSAFDKSDGCCVISGTGVCCFVRRGGVIRRIGGWGYMLDGGGSGYDLGRDAIAAALHEYDGQGEQTVLTGLLTTRMGAHPRELLQNIYQGGRAYVASFADVVFEGCRLGDSVSIEIMNRNAEAVARMIKVASRENGHIYSVALGGGVFRHNPEFSSRLRELVSGRIKLMLNTMPAVYGAALEAVNISGNQIPHGFRDNFSASYNNIGI